MANTAQIEQKERNKTRALIALLGCLDDESLPRSGSLTSGRIAEHFEDGSLPLQPRVLLEVLREAEIPHDSHNRFLPRTIYEGKKVLYEMYLERTGGRKVRSSLQALISSKDGEGQ